MACLVGAGANASALDFGGRVGYLATFSDNVRNDPTREISDWEHTPSAAVRASHESSRYALDADYRLQHRVYAKDSFPDDTSVDGRLAARVAILPDTLDWLASHVVRESQVNSRGLDTPDNTQSTSTFSTGPQARFRLDGRTMLSAGGTFAQYTAARSANDNRRWSANGSLERGLDGATTVGLLLQHSDVDYDSEFGEDFRSSDVRLTFDRTQGERTRLRIEMGGAFVATDDRLPLPSGGGGSSGGGDDDFNWTGSVELERAFTSSWSGSLSASRSVADSGSNVARRPGLGTDGVAGRSDQRQSYVLERGDIALRGTSARVSAGVQLSFERQLYDDARDDETIRGLFVNAAYTFGPTLGLSASASVRSVEFEDIEGDELQRRVSLDVRWTPLRNLGFTCGASWTDRGGSSNRSVEYDEANARIGFDYGF